MRSEPVELTDREIMRQIRAGRNPLRGLTASQVQQIERRALAKLRRQMGSEMMFRLRALAQEAARERRPGCTIRLNTRARLPMISLDDMEPTEVGADLGASLPARTEPRSIGETARQEAVLHTGPGREIESAVTESASLSEENHDSCRSFARPKA